jgi:flagellar secretion chaperone FliS
MYCNGIQSYRKTNIITSDPARLIIMCYEGAIDSLKLAKEKIKAKDYEKKASAIKKAQDIIEELICSLNFEKGGEIASNLESLYNYMVKKIVKGDLNKDVESIDEVIGMLNKLLSAWQEVASRPVSQTQAAEDSLYQEKKAMGFEHINA